MIASSPQSTILVVDDNQDIRDLLRRVLARAGFTVLVAWSAERALEILEYQPVDVAICDHHLQGRDGLWLANQIHASLPHVATVFMTGDADAMQTARGLGCNGYVAKPFDPKGIVEAIQHALARHGQQRRPDR